MDGGNGGTKAPLTPEGRAVKRQELWAADPDEFIHISEMIIGTRVLSSGQVQCVVGMPDQLLLEISAARIQYEIFKILGVLETQARQKQVVPVSGGIMNFVRGRGGK